MHRGGSPEVRVRGIGSYPGSGNTSPLFVVDGMFFDNIDFLSPADIKSLNVLKDASAAAIYGVRAANGVVIIETRSGRLNTPARITYDGYYGIQRAQNVLKMANAEQFTRMANESGSAPEAQSILEAIQRYGRSRVNPDVPDVDTDWYETILRDAPVQSHSIDVSGGGSQATYSVGVNYFDQEGILDMRNEYQRFNLRTKLDYQATDWFKIGGNVIWSNATRYNPDNSAWFRAYSAVPILPVFDPMSLDTVTMLANAQDIGYRGGQNPLVSTIYGEDQERIRKLLGNFFVEFSILPDDRLTFKSAYNSSFSSINGRNLDFPYFIGNDFQRENSTINKNTSTTLNQIWDNLLTYKDQFGKHGLTVLLGTAYRDEFNEALRGNAQNFPTGQEAGFFISQAEAETSRAFDNAGREYGFSYFSRLAYNFDNKYLLYGTFRADGTNKYQETFGYFPTFGAGWVVSEENFFRVPVVDYLKVRASWGQLGNDAVRASDGAATTNTITTSLGNEQVTGTQTSNLFEFLEWEVVEETNVGLTAELLNNKLSLDVDYYTRDTKNATIPILRPAIGGSVRRNAGVIRNSGLEVAVGFNGSLTGGLNYSIGANAASLKNEVLDVFNQPFIDGGSAEFRQRTVVGQPIFSFFGWQTDGVYQNQAEIEADPIALSNNLVPGDLRYVDENGDGVIDGDDRGFIGSYLPTFNWGGSIALDYRGFDVSATFFGQSGNQILNRRRGEVIFTQDTNVDAELAENTWRGAGTSNVYPSSEGRRKAWNQRLSNQWIEDGTFWRIQNVQLGYLLNGAKLFGEGAPNIRLYMTADRPLTVFDYNGFTPEIGDGVDRQTYPIAATYTAGLNVRF